MYSFIHFFLCVCVFHGHLKSLNLLRFEEDPTIYLFDGFFDSYENLHPTCFMACISDIENHMTVFHWDATIQPAPSWPSHDKGLWRATTNNHVYKGAMSINVKYGTLYSKIRLRATYVSLFQCGRSEVAIIYPDPSLQGFKQHHCHVTGSYTSAPWIVASMWSTMCPAHSLYRLRGADGTVPVNQHCYENPGGSSGHDLWRANLQCR